jgi:hypothetical protein
MLASLLFALKKLVATVVLPPNGPLLLSAAGLLLARRHARLGYAVAWAGLLMLVGLSTPLVSGWLERSTYVNGDATATSRAHRQSSFSAAAPTESGGLRRRNGQRAGAGTTARRRQACHMSAACRCW